MDHEMDGTSVSMTTTPVPPAVEPDRDEVMGDADHAGLSAERGDSGSTSSHVNESALENLNVRLS